MRSFLRKIYNKFKSVKIIMAHHVSDAPPDKSPCIISTFGFCSYLEGKRVVDVHAALRSIRKADGAIVLTFDDALEDLYTNVYRILKEKQLPFTAFISASLVGQQGYITEEQLKEMAADPLVSIGSHGCTHVKLSEQDEETAKREIFESKKHLEAIIGKPVELFAYPNGAAGKREIKLVKQAGYCYAFGVTPRKLNILSLCKDRYLIPRYNLTNENNNP